ncbi:MAG TPA: GIY-YIG nuclease family protein [Pyrinomonadaceae bacterium]|nr:GIY-YIG nuclease family protein [Pyrinomonadaceae bacterium]
MTPHAEKRKLNSQPEPRSLVINRLEKVSKDLFRKYFSLITELVGNSPGIYALYDGSELYYVGKSTDLKKRVKQHLRDRHLASWTHFSLYLVRKAEHIHEIESLLVRIANPQGNRIVPKGKSSGPMLKKLMQMVRQKHSDEFQSLFGINKTKKQSIRSDGVDGKRTLKGLVSKPTPLFREYKGKKFTATLNPDGTITLKNKRYNTPTAAAKAVVDRSAVNGWHFWYIEDLNGDWIKLYKHK